MKIVRVIMYPCYGTGRVTFTFRCLEEAIDFLDVAFNHIDVGHITVSVEKEKEEDNGES